MEGGVRRKLQNKNGGDEGFSKENWPSGARQNHICKKSCSRRPVSIWDTSLRQAKAALLRNNHVSINSYLILGVSGMPSGARGKILVEREPL